METGIGNIINNPKEFLSVSTDAPEHCGICGEKIDTPVLRYKMVLQVSRGPQTDRNFVWLCGDCYHDALDLMKIRARLALRIRSMTDDAAARHNPQANQQSQDRSEPPASEKP
jgi:hypothetical protein